MVISNE